jgi:uncharacterized membrane protein SpoIIM required for sporulation
MDVDVYLYTHKPAWTRLDVLSGKSTLTGPESDELIALYQRASLHLATLRVRAHDPAVVAGLSAVLARARGKAMGGRTDVRTEIRDFFGTHFPAAVYRATPWWLGVAVAFLTLATAVGTWVDRSAYARSLLAPENYDYLTRPGGEFETYYTEHPHSAFAAHVWTNNAWLAATALFTGFLLLPALYSLFMNAVNVGITGGLMAHVGRTDVFFGDILPHGMLELTAVFVAGGAGLKLGWTMVDPGGRGRGAALAEQGRGAGIIALGLVGVLLCSGLIEGYVTPSALPTPVPRWLVADRTPS